MSFRHARAAGLLPLRNPTIKAVLLALAHHANEYTGRCWPSVDRLALFTGLARRSVQNALREAEQLDLIRITERTGRPNVYDMTLPSEPVLDQQEAEGGAPPAPLPRQGGARPAQGGAPPAPKQSMNKTHAQGSNDDWDAWMPKPETIVRIMAEERVDQLTVDEELRVFKMDCEAKNNVPVYPDAAFRKWMSRLKDMRKKPASGPRSPATPRDRLAEVLRTLENKRGLIATYEMMGGKAYEIEHQLKPDIARLEAELASLQGEAK